MTTSNGRLALISGSTAGIGFAIAEHLLRKNIKVIVNGRTQARVDLAMAQLIAGGAGPGQVEGVAADATTPAGIETITKAFPTVDVLINNFGMFNPKPFADITDDDWTEMWNANVMSGVRLSRRYFPQMLQRRYGRVVFISSESALQVPADVIHYGVSKTAQLALARGMAELAVGVDVTVNSVLVGPTRSEGMGAILNGMAQARQTSEAEAETWFFQKVRPSSLLKRFLRPQEIGAFVAFLASDEASGITGAALRADGGVLRSVV